jgi:hypothetical protein
MKLPCWMDCVQNIRGRTRYLSHLPLTCEFQVVELDLHPPIVSESTLHEFAGQC